MYPGDIKALGFKSCSLGSSLAESTGSDDDGFYASLGTFFDRLGYGQSWD
jgi:hypothetical protein